MKTVITLDLKSKLPDLDQASARQILNGLAACGEEAEGYAKIDCPVKTGRLQNSITYQVKQNELHLGTNVEYAVFVETRDDLNHPTGKAHFLRDALAQHEQRWLELLTNALRA